MKSKSTAYNGNKMIDNQNTTVFRVRAQGNINKWSFNVQPGFNEDGKRLTAADCEKLAEFFSHCDDFYRFANKFAGFIKHLENQGGLESDGDIEKLVGIGDKFDGIDELL